KQSALLVTDYSSVGWDFAFLHKPVVYYQFDRHRLAPPHIDPDDELPGAAPTTRAALFAELERLATAGFAQSDEYRARARRFIDHQDRDSSERIVMQASTLRRKRNVFKRMRNHEASQLLWNRLRHHDLYIPAMKSLFRLAKL